VIIFILELFTMLSLAKLTFPVSAILTAALAIQNVTVVPLTNGCADYPGYDASTGFSAGFLLTLNSCDNSTVNGNGDTNQVIRHEGDTGIVEGRVGTLFMARVLFPLQSTQ
jgi:hypothetical protein